MLCSFCFLVFLFCLSNWYGNTVVYSLLFQNWKQQNRWCVINSKWRVHMYLKLGSFKIISCRTNGFSLSNIKRKKRQIYKFILANVNKKILNIFVKLNLLFLAADTDRWRQGVNKVQNLWSTVTWQAMKIKILIISIKCEWNYSTAKWRCFFRTLTKSFERI